MPLVPRIRAGAVLGLLAVVGLTAAPPVSPLYAASPVVNDWRPSVAECRRYGYEINSANEDDAVGYGRGGGRYRGYAGSGATGNARSPSAQAYAPPPPPPPPTMTSPIPPAEAAPMTSNGPAQRSQDQSAARSRAPMGGALGGNYAAPQPPQDTERYPGAASNPIRQVAQQPVSTFSIDVDTASYSNVRRFLTDGQAPPRDAVRTEELINYFNYDYPMPESRRDPFRIFTAVAPAPWNREHRILHIGIQGYNIPRSERPPLNLVFLVDTSGSMMSVDRLELAAHSLSELVSRLRPQDRVSLVAYAGSAGLVLPPTSGREPTRIRCALAALQAGGSTAGGQGLELAYAVARRNYREGTVNRVILMTDGDFNVGMSDPSRLRDFVTRQRQTGVYLSVYGYGRGNYNDTMMQALAQNGNGVAAYVDSLQEANRAFRNDFASSVFPIADDVKIQVEFNPRYVSEYRLIGYETRMLNREDFNNDRVDAGDVGSGASVTAIYEITPTRGAQSVDPLRYQQEPGASVDGEQLMARGAANGEIAFVKLRYKRPGESESILMTQPVRISDAYRSLWQAPATTQWATAVAAYGQALRGDPWLGEDFGWDDIIRLASNARGDDVDGTREQFIGLARAAERINGGALNASTRRNDQGDW